MRIAPASSVLVLALARLAAAQPEPAPAPPPEPAPSEPAPASDPNTKPSEPKPLDETKPAPQDIAKPEEPGPKVIIEDVTALPPDHGFRFGSYGRIVAGSDLRGGKPEKISVVAHAPRIVEDSYLEIDLSYGFITPRGLKLRPVITLAFDGTLFHDTGEFDAHPALRNMYLDAQLTNRLTAWVGSRMYRGDDIYLFDYWPLDDLNTVGGGLIYRAPLAPADSGKSDAMELAVHAGVNRLLHPFQFQQIEVANPEQGATTVLQLNRQRLVMSGTASYQRDVTPDIGAKLKVHGEVHALPSGRRARCDAMGVCDGTFEDLPSDSGVLVGAELSLYGINDKGSRSRPSVYRRHLNLYARYASGLAAFDELAPPTSFGADLTTSHASELSFGLSGNWDMEQGNLMLGALSRRFIDAAPTEDHDDGWEYALDARPLLKVLPDTFIGADISYQARFPRGLNPNTQRAEDPAVFEIAPMLVYSPMGPSGYDRPQLRVVYRAAHLNDGARDEYVPDDPRHAYSWVHFLGVECEWWFNSSTYR